MRTLKEENALLLRSHYIATVGFVVHTGLQRGKLHFNAISSVTCFQEPVGLFCPAHQLCMSLIEGRAKQAPQS